MIRRLLYLLKAKTISAIAKIDRSLFRGRVKILYRKIIEGRGRNAYFRTHPEEYYDKKSLKARRYFDGGRKAKVITEGDCAVADIILAQYTNNDYSSYKNYDMAVRLIAIEEYRGKNDYGFDLYSRMQSHTGFDWSPRFKKLIESYDSNGFDESKPIELSRDHIIMDGAHRLALAVATGKEFVPVKVYNCPFNRVADYGRFYEIGFTRDECSLIKSKTEGLLSQFGYDYVGVIWPPAYRFADDIVNDLNEIAPERFRVVKTRDMNLSAKDFEGFLRTMYHTDILDLPGMRSKTQRIMECTSEAKNGYNLRVFYLHINNPKIGTNEKNYTPQSLEVKRIKEIIRTRYKSKLEKYVYDVIMHISDNYIQSKFCKLAVEMNKDLSGLFNELDGTQYAVIKAEGRLPSNFPYYYGSTTEVDIVVKKDTIKEAALVAEQWMRKKFAGDWFRIQINEKDDTFHVNVMLRDLRVLCVHFQDVTHFGIKASFEDLLFNDIGRSKDCSYKICPPSYEVLIRAYEYLNHPQKTWHYEYIMSHCNTLDDSFIAMAYDKGSEYYCKIHSLLSCVTK